VSNTESEGGRGGAAGEVGSHHGRRRGGGGRTRSAGDDCSGSEPWSPPGKWVLTVATALLGFFSPRFGLVQDHGSGLWHIHRRIRD
jgi:hypothetical protein